MSLLAKIQDLNKADLSMLLKRIAAVKAELEKAMAAKGQATATAADIKDAARQAGVSVEEFMEALEYAKRMGLI
jgi:hypothetical protein